MNFLIKSLACNSLLSIVLDVAWIGHGKIMSQIQFLSEDAHLNSS